MIVSNFGLKKSVGEVSWIEIRRKRLSHGRVRYFGLKNDGRWRGIYKVGSSMCMNSGFPPFRIYTLISGGVLV
jgi:hypothetical protein